VCLFDTPISKKRLAEIDAMTAEQFAMCDGGPDVIGYLERCLVEAVGGDPRDSKLEQVEAGNFTIPTRQAEPMSAGSVQWNQVQAARRVLTVVRKLLRERGQT